MRSRNIKPQLFTNDLLATSDPLYTVIFEGLWCYCDREGRCEDRPSKIHLAVNPGRAYERTVEALDWLTVNEFIVRYQVGKCGYISVPKFKKHQNPHYKEPPSKIPPPPMMAEHVQGFDPDDSGGSPGLFDEDTPSIGGETQGEPEASTPMNGGEARLIPDSGFLIPDSPSQPFPPSRKGSLREAAENPRALGRNPRANGTNPRAARNRSLEAWDRVIETARNGGTSTGDSKIDAAVRQMGGYSRIGQAHTSQTPENKRRFRELYEQLLERPTGEEG